MELFLRHFGQRLDVKNPGVIDEKIDTAEGGDCFGERRSTSGFCETFACTAMALPPWLVMSATTRSAPSLVEEC
jgi:hypothetical protein